ncbi:30S ribosomal protein S19e [Thermofilum pendens]|uniref:Small ribosomal subunit protein eS19 n=1 Tax=Thermofilum pendens (strain DSM 2475 / Hrk 5) TaxID=368408 RepID=A1RXE9_THEPD|nr:30S ribosomal protein S19e [Thermofilum pendens]ABL77879.1 SSU ribosomal protein S19E [Thermofilum pendens Hrk 5]
MVNAKFVPPRLLIEELAAYLKENVKEIQPPEWALYAKTGPTRERPPQDPDWWYKRCAALLRKIYLEGPVGLERLRTAYGGRTKNTVKRKHFKKAGGSAIRKALQQLESAGLVAKTPRGRVITEKGRALVDTTALRIFKKLVEERPELSKYLAKPASTPVSTES